jgi:hypothetical protein
MSASNSNFVYWIVVNVFRHKVEGENGLQQVIMQRLLEFKHTHTQAHRHTTHTHARHTHRHTQTHTTHTSTHVPSNTHTHTYALRQHNFFLLSAEHGTVAENDKARSTVIVAYFKVSTAISLPNWTDRTNCDKYHTGIEWLLWRTRRGLRLLVVLFSDCSTIVEYTASGDRGG